MHPEPSSPPGPHPHPHHPRPRIHTHTLLRTTVLPTDPDTVWRTIGRFGGLTDWHPALPPSAIENGADPETPGAVQAFTVDGTVVARERLLAKDDTGRSYRYTLLSAPEHPFSDYTATLSALPHPQGTEVRWAATYDAPDEAVPLVEELFGDRIYATGLAALPALFPSTTPLSGQPTPLPTSRPS